MTYPISVRGRPAEGVRRLLVVAFGILAVLSLGLLLGVTAAVVPAPRLAFALIGTAVVVTSLLRPRLGAYLLVFLTPLLAGINRGGAIPVLRPSEALAALVGVGVVGRTILDAMVGRRRRFRPSRMDTAVLILATTSSVLPVLWMLARGDPLASDDLLYALMLWKFTAIYFIFRATVKTERQVLVCLWTAMLAGCAVSLIAILQSVGVGAVTSFVGRYYAPYGNLQAVVNNRGGATLGLPIAAADLLIFDLAIAAGFLATPGALTARRERSLAGAIAIVLLVGVLASGEFSAVIGLLVVVVALGLITRRGNIFRYVLPASLAAVTVLRPVVERRLAGFSSASGLPVSWSGRLHNLTSYFWPELFSHWRFLLGVRPAARVIVPTQATGYVWIESGYTWLLWSGGVPLLIAFGWFVYVAIGRGVAVWRSRSDAIAVAAIASGVGSSMVTVLMLFDPHLTYRGAADLLFALIALAGTSQRRRERYRTRSTPWPGSIDETGAHGFGHRVGPVVDP
jgi:hypothetical protein